MKKILLLFVLFGKTLNAQTDYTELENWHFHPDKHINILSDYNLDIAIIDKDLGVQSIISNTNNSIVNTGVDVFFVHPTQLTSIPQIPDTISIRDQPSLYIASTIIAQGGLLAKYGRFFAPKYRQSSPSSFNNGAFSDSQRATPLMISYSDVKSSFLEYLNNFNNGNRIILAGHSQGSYLLGMLLRDLFDSNATLKSKLVTAALGGMAYVYSTPGEQRSGWWENIPICTEVNQCECIHNWNSFKESQNPPSPNHALPAFNQVLVDSGLVYQRIDTSSDFILQDSLSYGTIGSPLRYYITPDNTHNLSPSTEFIAFDSLYMARFKRTSRLKAVLAIDYIEDPLDLRPNELLDLEEHPNFGNWGFHPKDYHIYLWALMSQIDDKLSQCNSITSIVKSDAKDSQIFIYPNPSSGEVTVRLPKPISSEEYIQIVDVYGRLERKITCQEINRIQLVTSGMYFLICKYGTYKILVQ